MDDYENLEDFMNAMELKDVDHGKRHERCQQLIGFAVDKGWSVQEFQQAISDIKLSLHFGPSCEGQ